MGRLRCLTLLHEPLHGIHHQRAALAALRTAPACGKIGATEAGRANAIPQLSLCFRRLVPQPDRPTGRAPVGESRIRRAKAKVRMATQSASGGDRPHLRHDRESKPGAGRDRTNLSRQRFLGSIHSAADRLVASRIVVRRPATTSTVTIGAAPVTTERTTTTTTTTTRPLIHEEKEAQEEAREDCKERAEEQIERRKEAVEKASDQEKERLEKLKDGLDDGRQRAHSFALRRAGRFRDGLIIKR